MTSIPIVEYTMEDYRYTYNDLPFIKFKWLGAELAKKIMSKPHRNATLSYSQLRFAKTATDNTKLDTTIQLNLEKYKSSTWLVKIFELCNKNNITVAVVEMHGYKKTRNRDSIGPYKLPFSEGHYPLYNFNSQSFGRVFNDSTDWIGNNHLNKNGAEKFTKHLYEKLLQD